MTGFSPEVDCFFQAEARRPYSLYTAQRPKLDTAPPIGNRLGGRAILGGWGRQLEIEAWKSMSHGALFPRSGRSAQR